MSLIETLIILATNTHHDEKTNTQLASSPLNPFVRQEAASTLKATLKKKKRGLFPDCNHTFAVHPVR